MKITQETKPQKLVKHPGGRPLFDGKKTEDVLAKLKEVWAIGGSDQEAAFYAEISTSALSRYLDRYPEIAEFREALRQKPVLKARQTIIKDLDNTPTAQWYLERKKPQEFSEMRGEGSQPIQLNIILAKINSIFGDEDGKAE